MSQAGSQGGLTRNDKKAPGCASHIGAQPGVSMKITIVCKVKVALSQLRWQAGKSESLGCLRIYPQTFHISYGYAVLVPKCRINILAQTCRSVNRCSCECVKLYITKASEHRAHVRAIIGLSY